MSDDNHTEALVALARRVWGEHWTEPMASLCDLSHRGLQRIKAAWFNNDDPPASKGSLHALAEALAAAGEEAVKALERLK